VQCLFLLNKINLTGKGGSGRGRGNLQDRGRGEGRVEDGEGKGPAWIVVRMGEGGPCMGRGEGKMGKGAA
jgi:hypothetical protein